MHNMCTILQLAFFPLNNLISIYVTITYISLVLLLAAAKYSIAQRNQNTFEIYLTSFYLMIT